MRPPLPLLALIALALSASLALTVGFTQGPAINSGVAPSTGDDLVCSWGTSGDTTAINVTWYRQGAVYSSLYDNTSLNTTSTIPSSATTKNEGWRCTVTLYNATANATEETNVTVQNSAPATPVVYSGATDVGTSVTVTEDATSVYDVNSTDADADVLTYYFKTASFCTVTDSASGAVSCTPTHAYIAAPNGSESLTNYNVTFWVDDDDPIFAKSASLKVTYNITPVNDLPSLTVPTQTTPVNATYNETFAATDEEQDYPLSASLDAAGTNLSVRDDIAVSAEGNSTVRIVYATSPVEWDDVGNHTVSVNLTDARNASRLVNFTLEVTSINRAPFFRNVTPSNSSSPLNQTYVLSQGESIEINLSVGDPDVNLTNQTIIFTDNSTLFDITPVTPVATNTTDALGTISYTATNDDIGNRSVTVTATSNGLGASTVLNFTIINVNDPPEIHDSSAHPDNTAGNLNLTPLVAYIGAPLAYYVNHTDLDTPWGDILSWSDNSSSFNITPEGLIGFVPAGPARNETVNITLQDTAGAQDSRAIVLEVRDNAPPYFNDSLPPLACAEGQPCTLDLSYYAKDDDPDDNVTSYASEFVGAALASFSLNTTSGMVSFIPLQAEIGNYTVNLTIEDGRGASDSETLNISVSNTEDAPSWDSSVDFSASTIVEGHLFSQEIYASDPDILLGADNLTFSANISWVNITYQWAAAEAVHAVLYFTPPAPGAYSIALNATDATGRTNTTSFSFTVLADTDAPVVRHIRPYGNDSSSDAIVQDWLGLSGQTNESVRLAENTTVAFWANASDDVTANASLVYSWYYDGVLQRSGAGDAYRNLSRAFSFFTAGAHTVRVVVDDTTLESASFDWLLNVTDVNRAPRLQLNLTGSKNNLSVANTNTIVRYFVYDAETGGFYDPDDDPNSDGNITLGSETLTLSYTSSSCAVANVSVSGNDLVVTPVSVGACTIQFTATDPYGSAALSNLVNITVTQVPQGAQTTSVSSGGGGGGTTTQNTLVPLQLEVETPKPLTILAPKLVTIYENQTIEVPIELKNNWTDPLRTIVLGAETNASNVKLRFDSNYVEELPVAATRMVIMSVDGYRLGESFEVTVTANVSDPQFQDSALILFTSIEQSQEGKDASVKVTFAQDLLSQNDECQELNEILAEADALLKAGNVKEAGEMVDMVINGCKYLISRTQQETQRPGILRTPFIELDEEQLRIISFLALGATLVVASAALLYYHFRTKEEYNF